ncbi:MgtC/SapB family protein [Numidum massiliense]|uniref:MgtC/SapB family protein n=1 Tax=Numidum massiliense TaxID=1522315 RepID=UPI0006D53F4D|nr:MgtC/SapB family protein [Numidum massiliense]
MLQIDYYIIVERLFVAAALGGIIGWERERSNKQAGVKTHLLVSVGSALIMLISIYGFADFVDHPNARYDPARLAAQVVNGIGFLGAGAILRHSNVFVSGLTTAATLWVVAAIGLSVGAGFYVAAIATTIIALISVLSLRGVEVKYVKRAKIGELKVVCEDKMGILRDISKLLEQEKIDVRKVTFAEKKSEGGIVYTAVTFRMRMPAKKDMIQMGEKVQQISGVKEAQLNKYK